MKPKLYLESTIPSYLVGWASRNITAAAEQYITQQWWQQRRGDFEVFISQVVLDEIKAGDPALARRRVEAVKPFKELRLTDEARNLTKALLHGGPLPAKAAQDAAHIAIAAVHQMHFLLTWNCRHIANANILRQIEVVCERQGHRCPVVCTPRELLAP
jgi:hypothetical protein